MKKSYLTLALAACCLAAQSSEIIKIRLFDGDTMTGKLYLPPDGSTRQLVIFIHGTGPGTYLDRRKINNVEFNYFDLFGAEFNRRGIAFFSYNKRGVDIGSHPPFYDSVNKEQYKKCLPQNEVKDVGSAIRYFKKDKRFKHSKITLLGWSEGTILATLAADDRNNEIAALMLAGYANDNLKTVIEWQHSGESSMLNIKKYLDANKDNVITREEYESQEPMATRLRVNAFRNAQFVQLDLNKDSVISSADFMIINQGRLQLLLNKIESGDNDWIWNNYFRVTTAWLREHFELEPNKTRMMRLNLPIYIFHGDEDANTPAQGVLDIKSKFDEAGKSNLHSFIFPGHNHDLNFLNWPLKNEIPEGILKIFEVAQERNK